MVRSQHLLNPAVEAFDHAVDLGVLRRGKTVLDAEVGAEQVELMLACWAEFALTEQAVGEFLPVIGQDRLDPDWTGAFQIALKPAGIGGSLGPVDPDEHPAGCPVNRHEQVTSGRFISHVRQILHIDVLRCP